MKNSKDYCEEALKDLGASEEYGVPIQAVTELALIKAMKDFLEELQDSIPDFQFDSEGSLLTKERNF